MPTLETARIRLRSLDERDTDFIVCLENDEDMWAFGNTRAPYPESIIRSYVQTYDPDPLRAGQLRLIIEEKTTSEAVGTIDITDIDAHALTCCIGIAVTGSRRRNGIAKEALSLIEVYCDKWLGICNLRADVAVGNEAARSLFLSAGYNSVGILRRWLRIGGNIVDMEIFQKLTSVETGASGNDKP